MAEHLWLSVGLSVYDQDCWNWVTVIQGELRCKFRPAVIHVGPTNIPSMRNKGIVNASRHTVLGHGVNMIGELSLPIHKYYSLEANLYCWCPWSWYINKSFILSLLFSPNHDTCFLLLTISLPIQIFNYHLAELGNNVPTVTTLKFLSI